MKSETPVVDRVNELIDEYPLIEEELDFYIEQTKECIARRLEKGLSDNSDEYKVAQAYGITTLANFYMCENNPVFSELSLKLLAAALVRLTEKD